MPPRRVLILLITTFAFGCGDEATRQPGDGNGSPTDPTVRSPDFEPAEPETRPDPGTGADEPAEPEPDPNTVSGPCLSLEGSTTYDFGPRFAGETTTRELTLWNCSRDWTLSGGQFAILQHSDRDGAERFTVSPRDPETGLTLAPGAVEPLILSYAPIADTPETHPDCTEGECFFPDGAILGIQADDGTALEIEILGIGTDNRCPVAIVHAFLEGTPPDTTSSLIAPPQSVFQLDGSDSRDPDGEIAEYHWEILEAPATSVTVFEPSDDIPNPTFEANVAGHYTLGLRVIDDLGLPSCDVGGGTTGGMASAALSVVPSEGIHVELSWTAADPDASDTGPGRGSDVDLHFLHPNADGTWNRAPWDCHWQNKVPNWGSTANEDNPSLARDDTDGWGPENINLYVPEGTPENPLLYGVGVHYFSDHGFGESDLTVRIFIDGEEVFARELPGFTNRQFWDVATIEWPSGEVTATHRLYPPNNLPTYFSNGY